MHVCHRRQGHHFATNADQYRWKHNGRIQGYRYDHSRGNARVTIKLPKVVKSYWMDENGEEKVDEIKYGDNATIFVETQNIDPGESIKIKIKEKDGQKIDGTKDSIVFSGIIKADGTADLRPFETAEDWNGEQNDNI